MNKLTSKTQKYINLNDYSPFEYLIPSIYLNIIIGEEKVKITSEICLQKVNLDTNNIKLKGSNIEIINIYLDNIKLKKDTYIYKNNELFIKNINKNNTTLIIESLIEPKKNISLLGMYESNGIITTQCEAEGFRKICFHPDRPDILSKYVVRIEANKDKYPILLSNGNLIKKTNLDEKFHEVVWEDPYPKPSYLFALVAGDLRCIQDTYTTRSNRNVDIHLYVEKGDEDFVQHAINSLKKAMEWDEIKYDLEYDLNLFNIVAIRHFNMGAMENKSLNIFNSKLVLADEETSTDDELERVEGVIAHEYFHNWTGNRITCRDWFQLSLKEGLTVFRDQQFTSDIHNYQIKRIEDVKFLRKNQFREDSGPTSHPVKPEKYLEIDNFYTTTIYEKGSEIIRMINTILTEDKFKKGFKDFILNYDGQAATIDQFIECTFNGNKEIDINKFKLWYKQNGTPQITLKRNWDKKNKTLTILISQVNPNKKNKNNLIPLIIPINIAVFTDKNIFREYQFLLKEKNEKFIIKDLKTNLNKPITSYFREFSAPVIWKTDLTYEEEIFIIENEKDLFTIYDSITKIYKLILENRLLNNPIVEIENKLIITIKSILQNNNEINLSLLSEILSIPTFNEIESNYNNIDPLKIIKNIDDLHHKFACELKPCIVSKLKDIEQNIFQKWPKGRNERKLIEVLWKLMLYTGDEEIKEKILYFIDKNNMTLSKSALNAFLRFDCKERTIASTKFYDKWKKNSIVLDNWFFFVSSIEYKNSIREMDKLFRHKLFDPKSPNTLRSILNGFVTNNPFFHNENGQGYNYIAKKIIKFDKLNPIIISRFIKVFSKWNLYAEPYKTNMHNALKYIDSQELSTNTREVIDMILDK